MAVRGKGRERQKATNTAQVTLSNFVYRYASIQRPLGNLVLRWRKALLIWLFVVTVSRYPNRNNSLEIRAPNIAAASYMGAGASSLSDPRQVFSVNTHFEFPAVTATFR